MQVTYSIALKLFSRKTSDPIQLLSWLKQILYYRTRFLQKHEAEVPHTSSCKILQQMYTMLETVLLLFLRHTSTEAVQISLSCFQYLVLEAELVQNPMEGMSVPYSPNLHFYKQLNDLSQQKLIGRAQQQKQNRSILKSLVHTPGSALAWEDTYSSWRVTKSLLLAYQRAKDDVAPQDAYLSRFATIRGKVGTTGSNSNKEPQITEENLQSEMLNWSNMTGFLCSLAGVSTKVSPGSYPLFLLSTNTSGSNLIDGAEPGFAMSHPSGTFVMSPVRDPINLRVKRSSSYHGGRPKSLHNPSTRGSVGTGKLYIFVNTVETH